MKDNEYYEPDAVAEWLARLDAQLQEIFSQPLPTLEPPEQLEPWDVDAVTDIGPLDVDIDIADIEPPECDGLEPFDVDAIADVGGALDAELFGDTDAPTGPETPRTGDADGGRV